ncbi:hypothetical protein WJX77_005642 [Trebouxia sp. C0004]
MCNDGVPMLIAGQIWPRVTHSGVRCQESLAFPLGSILLPWSQKFVDYFWSLLRLRTGGLPAFGIGSANRRPRVNLLPVDPRRMFCCQCVATHGPQCRLLLMIAA